MTSVMKFENNILSVEPSELVKLRLKNQELEDELQKEKEARQILETKIDSLMTMLGIDESEL